MRRVKVDEPDKSRDKESKRKMGRPVGSGGDEDLARPKPSTQTPFIHVAQQYAGKDNDIAQELVRSLRPNAARALGVRKRAY